MACTLGVLTTASAKCKVTRLSLASASGGWPLMLNHSQVQGVQQLQGALVQALRCQASQAQSGVLLPIHGGLAATAPDLLMLRDLASQVGAACHTRGVRAMQPQQPVEGLGCRVWGDRPGCCCSRRCRCCMSSLTANANACKAGASKGWHGIAGAALSALRLLARLLLPVCCMPQALCCVLLRACQPAAMLGLVSWIMGRWAVTSQCMASIVPLILISQNLAGPSTPKFAGAWQAGDRSRCSTASHAQAGIWQPGRP